MYNNLRFFKGLEYDLNFEKDLFGVYKGTVYLPEVSAGLYETINLFILEECIHNGDVTINFPIAETADDTKFSFEWEETNKFDSKSIILYDIDNTGNIPVVKELKSQSVVLFDNTNIDSIVSGVKHLNTQDNTAIQLNITLNSTIAGPHVRNLNVYSVTNNIKTLVAIIEVYGEVVPEDERLKVLLSNFGATLAESDFLLFKDHDISEMSPDYILLNRKRKELLLELHNIKPFVGTYKAVLNAIDFFGYDKITLKEYWLNIDNSVKNFGKLFAVPVPKSSVRGEATRKKLKFKLPSSTMKKTSKFSLVYRLNEPNGTFDQWDIPNVTETFDYTPQEVLIKLYGLKSKLQKEYLPLQAKIIDITAEGDYFTQRNINIWHNQNPIGYFSEGHAIKFKVTPERRELFIEDLSMVLKPSLDHNNDATNYNLFLNLGTGNEDILTGDIRDHVHGNVFDGDTYEVLSNNTYWTWNNENNWVANPTFTGNTKGQVLTFALLPIKGTLTELKDVISKFYDTYHNQELHSYNPNIPIGCPVLLDGTESFDDIWDEAKFTWEDAEDPNSSLKVTWANWWKAWVYEIEWVITGKTRGYSQTYRGAIDDYLILPLILPHNDKYDVEMRTYDLFGHRSHYKMKDIIDVKLKQLELYGIYKWLEDQSWDNKDLTWSKSGGYWNSPQDNKTTIDENIATLYLTLDRANYVHMESDQGVRFSTVRRYVDTYSDTGFSETTGPYQWSESTFKWSDTEHLAWDYMRVGPDLTASFKINDIRQGEKLSITYKDPKTGVESIGEHIIASLTPISMSDIAGWKAIMNELNASNDTIISKFNFNAVFEDTDNDDTVDVFRFMMVVGWEYSRNYDFESISILNTTRDTSESISGETHVQHFNPTWDDTRVFSDYAEVERSTHVTISTDISKFPGKKKAKWTITNITNPEITDIYYNNMWLTYVFKEPGYYSIQLEAEDTHGNKNIVKRNMLKVK